MIVPQDVASKALEPTAACETRAGQLATGVEQRVGCRISTAQEAANSAFDLAAQGEDLHDVFRGVLEVALELTQAQLGFIGEVCETAADEPYFKAYAIAARGSECSGGGTAGHASAWLAFRSLNELFKSVLAKGRQANLQDVVAMRDANCTSSNESEITSFLGLPFFAAGQMLGMMGFANRADGFEESAGDCLQPMLDACARIIQSRRSQTLA